MNVETAKGIDSAIHHVEMLLNRKLKGQELLIVAIAYQRGIIDHIQVKEENL